MNKRRQTGFSLLELVLAIAIFALGSVALATMMIDSNISTKLSGERTQALLYAKEGIEAVRAIRDSGWNNIGSVIGAFGLATGGDGWILSGSSDLIDDKYTRVVDVGSSSSLSSTTRLVSTTVTWALTPSRDASVVLQTILTDWRQQRTNP